MGNKRRCFVSKLNSHILFGEFQLWILAYEAKLISTVQSSLPPFYELKFRLRILKYGGGINFYTAILFPNFLWVRCLEGIKMYAPLQSDPSWQKAEQSGIETDVHRPIALPCAQPGTWWQYSHPAWHTRPVHSTANTCVLPGTPLGAVGKPVRAVNSFNKQHVFCTHIWAQYHFQKIEGK